VPFVSLILFGDTTMPVGRWVTHAEAQTAIGGLLTEGKSVSGSLREHELDFLFGEEQRKQIGSTAVVASAIKASTACWPSPAVIRSITKARWAPVPELHRRSHGPRAATGQQLPALGTLNMERQLDAYCEHLRSERQVSPHTLSAYRATSTRSWAGASNRTSAAGRRWISSVCAA
jgi:hypothetical protein